MHPRILRTTTRTLSLLCVIFLVGLQLLAMVGSAAAAATTTATMDVAHQANENGRSLRKGKKNRPHLVAITNATSCASDRGGIPLPYGPQELNGVKWNRKSPYFCTDCDHKRRSKTWKQVFEDNSGVLLEMTWKFTTWKTLKDRFNDAAIYSENVTWTMKEPAALNKKNAVTTLNGLWWWSTDGWEYGSEHRTYPKKISGSDFSQENGCWAAGNNVNGGDDSNFDNAPFDVQWGQCDSTSMQGHPFCSYLVRNGVQAYVPTLRSKLYVLDSRN